MFSLFLEFGKKSTDHRISDDEGVAAAKWLRKISGLEAGFIYLPGEAQDPYFSDINPCAALLEISFSNITALEIGAVNILEKLSNAEIFPGFAISNISQQAMLDRPFPCSSAPPFEHGTWYFTFVVSYTGPAEDTARWLEFYLENHANIMTRLPGILDVKVFSRIDWCSVAGHRTDTLLQRNRVIFRDAQSLTSALHAPVREELRRDGQSFPPFTPGGAHLPMRTIAILPINLNSDRSL